MSTELDMLRRATRELVTSCYTGWPDERWPDSWKSNWQAFTDLGLWSTLDPPDGSMAAAVVVAEELGGALYPGPTAESLAAAYVAWRCHSQVGAFTHQPGGLPARLVDPGPDTLLIVATPTDELLVSKAADADPTRVCNVAICAYAMSLAASGRLRPDGADSFIRWQQAFLWSRALTISGGSSEIIRNVLATQLLGLPRLW
jgi:alkylation response protein AidB-like acyl-CoA dehydrogenase